MREQTPIFNRLAARYRGPDLSHESFALKAYMRGFLYGLVLEDALKPPPPWPIVLEEIRWRRQIPYYSIPPVIDPRAVVVTGITP